MNTERKEPSIWDKITAVLLVCKLCGLIEVTWFQVFMPIYIELGVALVCAIIAVLTESLIDLKDSIDQSKRAYEDARETLK